MRFRLVIFLTLLPPVLLSFSHISFADKWISYVDPQKVFSIQYPAWLAPVPGALGKGLTLADATETTLAKCSFIAVEDPSLKKQDAAKMVAELTKNPSIMFSTQKRLHPDAKYIRSGWNKTLTGQPVFLLVYDYTLFYNDREIPMRGLLASAVNTERGYAITLGCTDLRSNIAKDNFTDIFQSLVVLPAGI